MNIANTNKEKKKHRQRISKACYTCRQKKYVRNPCTTCLQYGRNCEFDNDLPRKRLKTSYIRDLESRIQKVEKLLSETSSFLETKKPVYQKKIKEQYTKFFGDSSGCKAVTQLLKSSENCTKNNQSKESTSSSEQRKDLNKIHLSPILGMSNFHIRYLNKGQGDCMLFNSIVSEETILEYSLEDHVPKSIISNLINIYFSSDLLLPIVDREDFLDSYEGRGPSPPSTLLICAICAYACLLVKPCDPLFARESTTYEVVYKSISKLASTFFQTPSFTPSIESIQALCLFANHPPFLSFCCSSFLSSSDTIWIFTGLAVRLAQDLGLHRTVDSTNNSDSNMKRKRLWYCVYVTDRWHCLISEKPLAISDFDCDVDMKLAEKSNSDPNLDIFVSFIKLTKILGNILRLVHSARAKATEYRGEGIKKIIESLQNSLNVWYAETSPDLKKIEELDLQKSLVSYQDFYEHSKRLAKGGPLIICYHLAHISLYRPFMSLEESDVPFVSHCVKKCIEAAKQVIQLSQCISTDRMIKFGWNYSYYPVFFASLVHVTVSTSNHPDLAREATELYNVAVNKTLAPVLRNVPNGEVLVHLLQNLLGLLKRKQHIENSEYSEKHQSCFDATKQMMFAESPLSYSFGESFFLQDLIPPDLSAIYFNQNYQSI